MRELILQCLLRILGRSRFRQSTIRILRYLSKISGRSPFRQYTILGKKYKPMLRVLNEIKRRNVKLKELDALEIFGKDGLEHTRTYSDVVRSLEVWEMNSRWHAQLVRNLPSAVIKITDSYEEIKNSTSKYTFIVIDDPIGLFSSNHCDNFDFFPDLIFKITKDEALLIINIVPVLDAVTLAFFTNLSNKEYLERRASFYDTDDPKNISFDHIVSTYERFIEKNNYQLLWSFHVKRTRVYYLVLAIKKLGTGGSCQTQVFF